MYATIHRVFNYRWKLCIDKKKNSFFVVDFLDFIKGKGIRLNNTTRLLLNFSQFTLGWSPWTVPFVIPMSCWYIGTTHWDSVTEIVDKHEGRTTTTVLPTVVRKLPETTLDAPSATRRSDRAVCSTWMDSPVITQSVWRYPAGRTGNTVENWEVSPRRFRRKE